MSNPWTTKVVRCWVDLTNTADFTDVISGAVPTVFNSSEWELQLAFGIGPESSGVLANITDLELVQALVWLATNQYLNNTAALLDPSLTFTEWSAGISQRTGFERACHAYIDFPSDSMTFNLNGADNASYKITLHGDTTVAPTEANAFARTTLTIVDSGLQVTGTQQASNLIPAGAGYDGNGHYTLNGLTVGAGYRWTQGANDASVTNGEQTITVNNDVFWAQGTSVTLNGMPDTPVTSIVWYPATLTAAETETLLNTAPVNTFTEIWVKAGDGNYYKCTLTIQGGIPAWTIDQTSGSVSPADAVLNIFNVLWMQAQNGLYYACALVIQGGVPVWNIDQTTGTSNPP